METDSGEIGELALPHIRSMQGYVPGEQPTGSDWIKLNTNENPFPPSPRVEEAVTRQLSGLTKYPDPVSARAREALAREFQARPEQVLVGNGSDDVLNLLFRVFAGPEFPAAAMEPSYSLYPILASIQNAPFHTVPFPDDLSLSPEAIANCGANLFLLTSPNAPMGIGFSRTAIAAVAEAYSGILVVDEAYGAFAGESAIALLKKYPRLVVTRSFSKSHGLAGLRIGFIVGHPDVIALLDKVRDSYNVDSLAQAGLLGALSDPDYYRAVIGKVCNIRNYYQQWFEKLGWNTYPSQSNFLTTQPRTSTGEIGGEVARNCFEYLRQNRILVRYFGHTSRVSDCLRISIGTESQMESLEEAIRNWLDMN